MTNFEYYIKGGKAHEIYEAFLKTSPSRGMSLGEYNKWLLKEHEEPILDDTERKYLSNVIKPFRDRVEYISKEKVEGNETYYITIFIDDDYIFLPYFKESTKMYVGMKPDKRYTLKELGL